MSDTSLERRELDGSIEWDDLHMETKKLLSRRGLMKVSLFGAFTIAIAACGDDKSDSKPTTPPAPAGTKSLYERLGGNAAITAVIGDFVDNQVVPDTRINLGGLTTGADLLGGDTDSLAASCCFISWWGATEDAAVQYVAPPPPSSFLL